MKPRKRKKEMFGVEWIVDLYPWSNVQIIEFFKRENRSKEKTERWTIDDNKPTEALMIFTSSDQKFVWGIWKNEGIFSLEEMERRVKLGAFE